MGISDQRIFWLDCIDLLSGSYRIGWIVLYQLYRIVSAGLYQETLAFMRWLVTGWMGRMDWMGHWWDGGGMDRR